MNTKLSYLYRDASNYKQWHEIVFAGQPDVDAIKASLWEGNFFIPEAIGLPALQERFAAQGFKFPTEDDHCWHEIVDIEPTEDPLTSDISAAELTERFTRCAAFGWESFLTDLIAERN